MAVTVKSTLDALACLFFTNSPWEVGAVSLTDGETEADPGRK